MSRKNFILDTSVLLYDKHSISSFPNNNVIIPLVVLDELDRFKDKSGLLGENARFVNRYLDSLRQNGSLHEGVNIDNDQIIRVEECHSSHIPESLSSSGGDNRIIGIARFLKEERDQDAIIITKDINFRVKCDALEIESEDYNKDKVVSDRNEVYLGHKEIFTPHSEIIDQFYRDNSIPSSLLECELSSNQYVIVKSHDKCSFLGVEHEGNIIPLVSNMHNTIPIAARNKEQKFAIDLLTRPDITLATLTGLAGSGKTFLTLMAGLSGIFDEKYERIVLTRTLQPVGRSIGYLPGDIDSKLDPWIGSILDNYRAYFKDTTYFEMMRQKGKIEVSPLAFIRGRTFNNTLLIVDEAQNSTIHELKTIITRVGEGSKIVLLGDIGQIDTPYIDSLSNGLTIIVEKLKGENITGHVCLLKGERSELATLVSKLI
jgi:PhoH-like ATPase